MYRKYNNKKVMVDGIKFDSKKEAKRYQELKVLEQAGHITDLKRQAKYVLIPAQYEPTSEVYTKGKENGKLKKGRLIERECAYYADFVYRHNGEIYVEDTKGVRTPEYIIKRKLMLYVYGIEVREL